MSEQLQQAYKQLEIAVRNAGLPIMMICGRANHEAISDALRRIDAEKFKGLPRSP